MRLVKWIFACYMVVAAFALACRVFAWLLLNHHPWIAGFGIASIFAIPTAIKHYREEEAARPGKGGE